VHALSRDSVCRCMAIPLHVPCRLLAACPAAAYFAPGTSTLHIRKVHRGRHVRAAQRWGELTLGSMPSCQVLASFPKSARLWGREGGGSRLLQVSSGPEIASRDCPLQAGSGHWPPPVHRTIQRRPSCPWTLPRPAPSGSSLSGMLRTRLQEDSEVVESRSWSCRVATAAECGRGGPGGRGCTCDAPRSSRRRTPLCTWSLGIMGA
jgi:hypothetical protein